VSDGTRVLTTIAILYKNYKPLQFFGIITILCVVIAVLFALPGLIGYVQTGLVTHGISLLIGGYVVLAGILSLICGLILNTVVGQARQDFEIKLNMLDLMLKERRQG
jgi:small-conductance mechanosensitive channel